MEKVILKFLGLFKWVFKLVGADYDQLRAIVATKLMMDNRRHVVLQRSKKNKETTNSFIVTLLSYLLFGGLIAIVFFRIENFFLSMLIFFSYINVMIAMTLITDFSSILLDTSDNTIILPRPVDGRTIFVSRVTHIFLYLGQLSLGLSIIPTAAVFFLYGGDVLILFVLGIILSTITAVFLTNGVYLLILQFSTEEKLKNLINYFQIGMAVTIMAGYQILPRLLEHIDVQAFQFNVKWWSFLLPPVWMAGSIEGFYHDNWDGAHIALAVCAVLTPPVVAFLVNRYLTPVFSRKLGSLGGSSEQSVKSESEKKLWIVNISQWVTYAPFEKGAFDTVFKILGRDRKIKLKIYPSFGYIFVFGFIFILRGKEDIATNWANLPTTDYHIVLLYLTFMILQVALHEIPYSDDYKASWIYASTPLDKPGEILTGTLKAAFIRLFVPGYLFSSIFVLFVWGMKAADDVLFGLLNNILIALVLVNVSKHMLPFSMAPSVRSQSGNVARSILSILVITLLGLLHYGASQRPLFMLAALPVQLILIWYLYRRYKSTTWRSITL